jgi:hypothetical protein
MWFIFVNIFLMMVYLLKGTKDAELVKVSFEDTTDGYAVVERAEMITNFSSFSFA